MPHTLTPAGPGTGEGWSRLVAAIREQLAPAEIDRIWVFRPIRHQGRDFGTAILSRVDGDRRLIYTASFILAVKGKTRGQFTTSIEEVGSGPLEALDELLALVPKRTDDEEPPVAIPLERWFPPDNETVAEREGDDCPDQPEGADAADEG